MVVAATGFFDGVHKGHRKVLGTLCEIARREGKKSAVVTFWPHPRSVLQQGAHNLRLLNSLEEKKELIRQAGVDEFFVLPFSREFSKLSSREFVAEYLRDKFAVSTLIIGYDHRMGHSSSETQEDFIKMAAEERVKVVRVSEFIEGDLTVSSTKIRNYLVSGELAKANDFLGYNYSLKGVVVSGKKLGRKIGFPTANLALYEPLKVIPGGGVYGVKVELLGKVYKGVCNIGTRPTVNATEERTIETHILDFNEDIYGLDMRVEFFFKIRDEVKFASLEELASQIEKDKRRVKETDF